MKPSTIAATGLIFLFLAPRGLRGADEAKPIDLLRLPLARLETSTAPASEWPGLKALTDNNPATVARMPAGGEAVDVVYGFAGGMVAPERVVVTLPREAPADTATARVEILVSTISASAGFWSLRSDPLKRTAEPQTFAFPQIGARWIMLRFTPAPKAAFVAIADIAVLGHDGPPASRYAFNEAPAKAFEVLERLKKSSSLQITISAEESALFADVKDGNFTKWSFAEAVLLASGIADASKRRAYLKRLDSLEADARAAVASATTPFEKGEKLLAWLHGKKGPLAAGYSSRQTDLSAVLDTSTYNCVSSAALYNILGRRLGLDLRAIEVPDHAFSILYDGTRHADVETTTSSGFDPARDAAAREKFSRQTGFRYIPESHRDRRREIGEAGLAAIIFYNHGVRLREEKRYHEALLANFRAMSLDREFNSAVKNALACLGHWSSALAGEGKFEEALIVLDTGVTLAPRDAMLLHNRKVTWGDWAQARANAGRDDEAIAILRKAQSQTGDGQFSAMQAWIYLRPAEALVHAGAWEKAQAAIESGLARVDKMPGEDLRLWLADLPLRRSSSLVAANEYGQAVDVLRMARERNPKDRRLTNNLVYTIQEWARSMSGAGGEEKARTLLLEQRKRFPDLVDLKSVAAGHAQRTIRSLEEAGKYEQALAALDRNRALLDGDEEIKTLSAAIFDRWARKLSEDKQWPKAVEIYEQGLKRLAGHDLLKTNLTYTMQEWVRDVNRTGGQEKARAVLLDLRKRFPDQAEVNDLARAHVQRVVAELRDQDKFAEGLKAIEQNKDLLKNKDEGKTLAYSVYDRWARGFTAKKDWQGALDVYAKALRVYPKDGHLTNNGVFICDSWARTFFGAKQWAQAIRVYEKSLEQFPDSDTLRNNLNYCKEQLKKQK